MFVPNMKKIVKIQESDLKNLISNTIATVLTEGCPVYSFNYNNDEYPQHEPIVEMARINKKENGKGLFPFDSWEVKIWSNDNDHEPSHFHIIKDGWNVSFSIENGEVLNIISRGKKMKFLIICVLT